MDYARSESYNDGSFAYGAHWWLKPDNPEVFYASGYDGQRILLLPKQDVVIVRCGRTPAAESPYVWERLDAMADLLV